jgi:hypothetical protein
MIALLKGQNGRGCGAMQRVDGYYLYAMGMQIHPLAEIEQDAKLSTAFLPLIVAQGALEPFLHRSIFKLRTSMGVGLGLLQAIKTLLERAQSSTDPNETVQMYYLWQIRQGLQNFEAVLAAEFGLMDMYVVSQKGGLSTADLIANGAAFFPISLGIKAPEAIRDAQEAARCIAYELPSGAGFHLHRANEAVLRRYYDAVTGGKPRPASRNVGDFLNEMNKYGAGDARVKSALKDLKDLHRNPLIHPEYSLESVDEAIDLLGIIRSTIGQMLKELPELPLPPVGQTTVPASSSPSA